MAWSRRFEDPIALPDGRQLVSLADAAALIRKLPAADQESPHWQTAIDALIMAAEDRGPIMHARIGMLRALNHGRPAPVSEPRRKRARSYRIIR